MEHCIELVTTVKERIVLSEIHLRTTGRHYSQWDHTVLSAARQR